MSLMVTGLHIYPVKSCRGISMAHAEVAPMGFRYDRQWMFVDDQGMFVAQRSARSLGIGILTTCLVETVLEDAVLTLRAPHMPPLQVPLDGTDGSEIPVRVWDSHVTGFDQGDTAAAWATEFLSRERPGRYRLVRMANDRHRAAKLGDGQLAFGDAYPFMVMSEESVADLNHRLLEPLRMDRFRANIVISGARAYGEDDLDRFRIGEIDFVGTTLCVRCPVTATNQQTAERGKEPLRTLATYRKQAEGVVLGRYCNHTRCGWIHVGDPVVIGQSARRNHLHCPG